MFILIRFDPYCTAKNINNWATWKKKKRKKEVMSTWKTSGSLQFWFPSIFSLVHPRDKEDLFQLEARRLRKYKEQDCTLANFDPCQTIFDTFSFSSQPSQFWANFSSLIFSTIESPSSPYWLPITPKLELLPRAMFSVQKLHAPKQSVLMSCHPYSQQFLNQNTYSIGVVITSRPWKGSSLNTCWNILNTACWKYSLISII